MAQRSLICPAGAALPISLEVSQSQRHSQGTSKAATIVQAPVGPTRALINLRARTTRPHNHTDSVVGA